MKKSGRLVKLIMMLLACVFMGFVIPEAGSVSMAAETANTVQTEEIAETAGASAQEPSEEETFMIMLFAGILVLLAIVAAVVVVIVSGTTAAVVITDSDEE